jgi:hypothetical protein
MRLTLKKSVMLALFSAHPAFADPNVLPVTVSKFNLPTVTITVCTPGGDQCKTIPNILLDSGSDGLRLFANTLPSGLPKISSTSESLSICSTLGGGVSLWGPFVTGDVILGTERATGVPIQTIDPGFSKAPDGCSNLAQGPESFFGLNGILGIGGGLRDFSKISKAPTNGYYACTDDSCRKCPIDQTLSWNTCGSGFPASPKDYNPIGFLPSDNNGWILQLPAPPEEGIASVTGTLTLGLGTRDNNAAPSTLTIFHIDSKGYLSVLFQDTVYNAVLDTGTAEWLFPKPLDGVSRCGDSGALAELYCPATPQIFQATLFNNKVSPMISKEIDFELENLHSLQSLGANTVSGLSLPSSSIVDGSFLLGMPFFLGRTVYYGLSGAQTPLGQGPFDAF